MQIQNSADINNTSQIKAIIDVMEKYESKYPSKWNRSKDSMYNEWIWHNRMNTVSYVTDKVKTKNWRERTQHVDLDNDGENIFPGDKLLNFGYYF